MTPNSRSGIGVPLDSAGKPVELTAEAMETLLRTHVQITDENFRQLASDRAFHARTHLIEKGQVARERIFILDPQVTGGEGEGEKTGAGQVRFSLK